MALRAAATLTAAAAALAVARAEAIRPDVTPATLLWTVAGEGWGTPAADADHVYVLSRRHEVRALDRRSGREAWRERTGEPGDVTDGTQVRVAGDIVAVGDYNIIGIDRRTGRRTWRFVPKDGYGPGLHLGYADDDLLTAGSPAGLVYAVQPSDGTLLWQKRLSEHPKTTVYAPVADDAFVFAGYSEFGAPLTGGLVALDRTSGEVRWRAAFRKPDEAEPSTGMGGGLAILGDLVVASADSGVLYAFDKNTGRLRATLPAVLPDRDLRPLRASPPLLLAGSMGGALVAFDAHSLAERWRFASRSNGSISFGFAASATIAYLPFVEGDLVAVDLTTGKERWRTTQPHKGFYWAPLVTDEAVYAASSTGGYYALSP